MCGVCVVVLWSVSVCVHTHTYVCVHTCVCFFAPHMQSCLQTHTVPLCSANDHKLLRAHHFDTFFQSCKVNNDTRTINKHNDNNIITKYNNHRNRYSL